MKNRPIAFLALTFLSTLNPQLSTVLAQGTSFTYQGRLIVGGNATNGFYDLSFTLFGVSSGGSAIAGPVTNAAVGVSNGLFTTALDLGANFPGADRWLEIGVRTNGGGAFTTLVPRQPITPTPYAVFAENVGTGGIAGGTYTNAVTFNNAGNSFSGSFAGDGTGLTNLNAATLGGLSSSNFWKTSGNNVASGQFIGSTNNQPLELKANNQRALRLEPNVTDVCHTTTVNVVGGSSVNYVSNGVSGATISGGGAEGVGCEVSVPATNSVSADFGTVGGGAGNTSAGFSATAGGGLFNTSSGNFAAVGGGWSNVATNELAMVPGGFGNKAYGRLSFAAGNQAVAQKNGSFVWADSSSPVFDPYALAGPQGIQDSFNVRSIGGFYIVTAVDSGGNITAGVRLSAGSGSWTSYSDRNAKENFAPVNGREVLEKVAGLPLATWNYRTQDKSVRHLGPMAQDFAAAFHIGEDDTHITTVDEGGVALAAIQGLNEKVEVRIQRLEAENAESKARLEKLERLVTQKSGGG